MSFVRRLSSMKYQTLSFFALAFLASGLVAPLSAGPIQCRIEADRNIWSADTPEHAIIKVSLEPVDRPPPENHPPVNLAVVLDRSGSMDGEKIEKAREAAVEAFHRLAADDIFSFIIFDDVVETVIPAQRVGDIPEAEARIRSVTARNNTNIFGGVNQGVAELRKHLENCGVNRVILLSDGLANVGPSSPDDFARLGAALLKEGISITTMGVGTDYNEDLMTQLARRSDGNTYFVESSRDLPRIFNEELGDVLNVVARKVVIEIQFPEGVRPLGLIGREGEIRNGKVVLNLNQLYGGQEKFVLVEVAVAPIPAGPRREVARARVSFDDELTQRHDSVASILLVPFSSDRVSVVKSANLKVQADYAANVIAVTREKAVELVDAGKNKEAAEQLRSTSARLNELGASCDNSKVSAMAAANKAEADRLETQGLDNIARKTYRTEDAQTISQQGAETGSREPSHQR